MRWPVYLLVAGFVAFAAWGTKLAFDKQKDETAVPAIHAQHITLTDVMGENLPPPPDQVENDSTVAGIDKNNNGVRDDVELAIFKKYPNSAKIRAAELQYASVIQRSLTEVYDNNSWIAIAQEWTRAIFCIVDTYPKGDKNRYNANDPRSVEVEKLVLNTQARKDAYKKAFDFTTSYGDLPGNECDIDLTTLPN